MPNLNLEERIQRIEDELALKKLIETYSKRADEFDWHGWAGTYTENALDEFDGAFGTSRGRQEIMERARDFMEPIYDDFMHYIVNIDIDEIQGDRATGTSNIIFLAMVDSEKPSQYYMAGGRYKWVFERTSEGWRIAHKKLRFLWNNGADNEAVFEPRD